jgi:hypothetical protein
MADRPVWQINLLLALVFVIAVVQVLSWLEGVKDRRSAQRERDVCEVLFDPTEC